MQIRCRLSVDEGLRYGLGVYQVSFRCRLSVDEGSRYGRGVYQVSFRCRLGVDQVSSKCRLGVGQVASRCTTGVLQVQIGCRLGVVEVQTTCRRGVAQVYTRCKIRLRFQDHTPFRGIISSTCVGGNAVSCNACVKTASQHQKWCDHGVRKQPQIVTKTVTQSTLSLHLDDTQSTLVYTQTTPSLHQSTPRRHPVYTSLHLNDT